VSKKINVNPGQYKLRGRERQGEDVIPQREKAVAVKVLKQGNRRSKKPRSSSKRSA
jgi:hypothetical protein